MMHCVLDTNLLIYAATFDDPAKTRRADDVLVWAANTRRGILPAQVLAEFSNFAFKGNSPFSSTEIESIVGGWMAVFPILPLTGAVVSDAIRGVRSYQFSYYDAQIWAAARFNDVPVVLSEDFNSGARIEGVRFINPFDKRFTMESLADIE